MPNPIYDPAAFMTLDDVRAALGKNGRSVHHYQAKAWLAERGILPVTLSPRLHMIERSAVEAALAGKPTEAPTIDPTFDPSEYVTLADVRRLFGAGRLYDNRRVLVWLGRAGVPVFRPSPRVSLVPKAALKAAMIKHTEIAAPVRRNARQNLPPYVQSLAQRSSHAKATKAASERHAAVREGRTPPKRTPRLKGVAAVGRKRELTAWARDARAAERNGKPVPPVPEVDHSPAPRFQTAARAAATINRPRVAQPTRSRRIL
jgi:hypothetical protein